MSDKGIYTAVSGAMAQSLKLETISNNIANANTPAFKKDAQVFQEYLSSYEKAPDVLEVPRVPASTESFYHMNGGDKSYVDVKGTYTDFSQGSLKQTGNALDVAIEGKGLFEILAPSGVQYSRNGNFKIDAQRRLVTNEGYPVLAANQGGANDPTARVITLPNKPISISDRGEISADGQNFSQLSVVEVQDRDSLKKVGSSLYALKDGYPPPETNAYTSKLHQGFVEGSNVNIVQEMTDMISTTRVFESTQKVIQAYDQMSEKMINSIPRF